MSNSLLLGLRRRDVLVVMAAALAAPAFVACGARSTLGDGPFDAGTDVLVAPDVRPDRDGDARDADDAADTSLNDARPDAPLDAKADAKADVAADVTSDVTADVTTDAGSPLVLMCVAVTQDHVQAGDQGLTPDGQPDGQLTATGEGPFDALILVTVDGNGKPMFGQQWDTLIGQDPIPQGFPFSSGGSTWILGVWENGVRANDNQGRIALPAGPHVLTLFAADSGYFAPGVHFRLHARVNGVWSSSNVALWP